MPILFLIIYIIGTPISYAIIEESCGSTEADGSINMFMCIMWPAILLYGLLTMILYPIYWLTKKLIINIKKLKL